MANCPKCRGQMTAGQAYMPDVGTRVRWLDGQGGAWKSLAAALGIGAKAVDLAGRRCLECGFVEFYAQTGARPSATLSSVEEETQQLRSLVARLQERIATLETIATDPAERTAREIEELRRLPPVE